MRRANQGWARHWNKGTRVLAAIWWMCLVVLAAGASLSAGEGARAAEADWIWSPRHEAGQVPSASCYFRRTFSVHDPVRVQLSIAADDRYEVYLNGQKTGSGDRARETDEYDLSSRIRRGRNTLAVKVTNTTGSTAGLAARLAVREKDSGWVSISTNPMWVTNLRPLPFWYSTLYNDQFWERAQSFPSPAPERPTKSADSADGNGRRVRASIASDEPDDSGAMRTNSARTEENGATAAVSDAGESSASDQQIQVARGFQVQRVLDAESAGSLLAMAFNEFGQIIASREGESLVVIEDSDDDQIPDFVRTCCQLVTNVQGILPLNGDLYVTGDGPEGNGLYRLTDDDHDGTFDAAVALVNFEGEMGEHGAHGITLGPDGWLYVAVGNHTSPRRAYDEESPHQGYYAGDLVRPRFEDPGGHAAGRKAPGGVVIRLDVSGQQLQLVAGGVRNAYDLTFNAEGSLFLHDSDMESDQGTTWYRPTRLNHVTAGSEFGWRSGWAKWPDYYVDTLPAAVTTGRGSPTGAVCYDHFMYPRRFYQSLFLADWSEGRILRVTLKRQGATYSAESEVFLQGRPLTVTDLDVGPDGWLYFITGGRGTTGGLYRVVWQGEVPDAVKDLGSGISAVIRQPQLQSAWGRQAIARLQQELGDQWGPQLVGVAQSTANPTEYRLRALDVMQLFGPAPSAELLTELSADKNEIVRSKAAALLGLLDREESGARLVALLSDSDAFVRRTACESLVRADVDVDWKILQPLLVSDDRFEASTARRVLERIPVDTWRNEVLTCDQQRLFIQGGLALVIAQPNHENGMAILDRAREWLAGFVSDRDFIDMLRLSQVAILQGKIDPGQLLELRDALAEEFPASNPVMNRELIRLLVYLKADAIRDRMLQYVHSDIARSDKVHTAMYMSLLNADWTFEQKKDLLLLMAEAKTWEGGSSYPLYLGNAMRQFARHLSPEESLAVLEQGQQWPDAALAALYKLPAVLNDKTRQMLIDLDRQIDRHTKPLTDTANNQLMVGLVAVLARSGDAESVAYLREIWDRSPERREPVAMGLAQQPNEDNWDYLIRSLAVVEDETADRVLQAVTDVNRVPDDPEYFRQVILCGLRLKETGAEHAIELLERWTGQSLGESGANWQPRMAAWQQWFRSEFPDAGEPELPVASEDSKWTYDELLEYLDSDEGREGNIEQGELAFQKANCAKCHRYGNQGEAMGPDLSDLSHRFTRKETLQSLLFPSHVISSQYQGHTLQLTTGRLLTGLVGQGAAGEKVVLTLDGDKISVDESDIEEVVPSRTSTMPTGLLNELTQEDIRDLFAFLNTDAKTSVARRTDSE